MGHDKRMNEQTVNKLCYRSINIQQSALKRMFIQDVSFARAMICTVFIFWTHSVHDMLTHAFVVIVGTFLEFTIQFTRLYGPIDLSQCSGRSDKSTTATWNENSIVAVVSILFCTANKSGWRWIVGEKHVPAANWRPVFNRQVSHTRQSHNVR